jgi:hypothetical protein
MPSRTRKSGLFLWAHVRLRHGHQPRLYGRGRFEHIPEPGKVRDLIESLRKTTAGQAVAAEKQSMVNMVKRRINPPPPPPPAPPPPPKAKKRPRLSQRMGNAFSTYIVEGDTITYRKHLLILLIHIGPPSLLALALLVLAGWLYTLRLTGQIGSPSPLVIFLTTILLLIPLAFWWGYQYVDWSNDIYRVTPDKVIDSEKKPLGDEITKSAPLENIVSMSLERKGLIGIVLNYGNVVINTGTDTKFTFYNIRDPGRAQRDIYTQKYALEQSARLRSANGEEIVDWLAAYHRSDELRRQMILPGGANWSKIGRV